VNDLVIDRLRSICGDAAVLREPVQLLTYECDALPHLRETPAVVVLPSSTSEVQQVVQLCSAEGIPFVARGRAGLSTARLRSGAASAFGCPQ
jgi:glycolate oxidase